ncbi:helix-turn-helix transcriptional regulator [Rhodoferax sp. PAMC 29310]|jgi:transcriptional regulator with XRE-family HTH domain|uniref:helix-turn-helix domain-containing protein n=1 Tax=Rhodoferax sp. PAMC 29310 TaxID=2822760 RepID=UPI001B32B723|nr:helix-turn-helix transcriptional regulator [Rhodoferax sp. PAMC 29310]
MDHLNMPVSELAKRLGVSGQSVRHWLSGRSFPGKAKCNLIEDALTFKLDFSEGESTQSITVEQSLKETGVKTLLAISKLPPQVQLLFSNLAAEFVAMHTASKTPEPWKGTDSDDA